MMINRKHIPLPDQSVQDRRDRRFDALESRVTSVKQESQRIRELQIALLPRIRNPFADIFAGEFELYDPDYSEPEDS